MVAPSTTLATANQLLPNPTTLNVAGSAKTSLVGTATGFGEITSQGTAGAWLGGAVNTNIAPTGLGWFLDATTLDGQDIIAGNWQALWRLLLSANTATADLYTRFYIYNPATTTYTQIGYILLSGQSLTATIATYTTAAQAFAKVSFPAGTKLYVDLWANITATTMVAGNTINVREANAANQGQTNENIITPGFQPTPSPVLATSPTTLSFSANQGGSNPASQNDTLSETAGVATAWTSAITYGSGSGWLAISPTSGSLAASGNATIVVSPTTGALSAGTYSATITFTATTGGATATITVTFTITAPALSTSPTSLSFTATVSSGNPASQSSTLSETHGVGTAWTSSITYGSGSGWLSISPTSGTLAASGNTVISVQPLTGSLAVGTYTATVTLTATTGGATATISVSFLVQSPLPVNHFRVTLAGQDITLNVDQLSINIDDTLGQGAGAGSSGSTQGRASTFKFETNIGPMNTALGAGQAIPPTGGPYLVRQGEVIVYDNTGAIVWAGFATKYTDVTTSKLGNNRKAFTAVEGIDYSTSLQRTLVNEVFSAATDVYILRFVLQKYAPWINLQYLPTNPAYTFPIKNFRNQTLEQVIQTIAGITGYLAYVDYQRNFRYVSPTVASSAPYNVSTNPDFVTTFPAKIDEFLVDDNSAINRVFFYGGTKLSNDFFQDVSGLADGSNLVFVMAFYPSPLSTGGYSVSVNGVPYATGTANGQSAKDQFISAGGTAQVLVDPGSRTATFDTGLAPAGGSLVLLGYRYSFPLSLVLTDETSHKFFGSVYLDGAIDDNTIFDIATAIQRCKILLSQQSFGLTTLKLTLWNHPGVQAGMVIRVFNDVRGINGSYLVQEVQIEPIGGGNFYYHLSLGAWNWGLIDFLLKLPTLSTFADNQTETQEIVTIESLITNVQVRDTWSTVTRIGPYYARSAPVGDGHDAYPGFATISS